MGNYSWRWMNHKLAMTWRSGEETKILPHYSFSWKNLHQERGQVNTIMMERFNSTLFYKSGPTNKQHTYQSVIIIIIIIILIVALQTFLSLGLPWELSPVILPQLIIHRFPNLPSIHLLFGLLLFLPPWQDYRSNKCIITFHVTE